MLAYRDPTQQIVYDNYMTVRKNLQFLKSWIDERLDDIESGKTLEPEKTFACYWLKNGEDSEYFNHKDVVFECFHNFVAFSQWGNSLYNIMAKLGRETGDAQTKEWFTRRWQATSTTPEGGVPAARAFVMELFRTISPNGGSISALQETRPPPFERHGYIVTRTHRPVTTPSNGPTPTSSTRRDIEKRPTSQEIDEARIRQMGLASARSSLTTFEVKDGRKASLNNSAFGTVFGVADDKPDAGVRLCRLRTVRLRLSPLSRRAAHGRWPSRT